MKIKLIDETIEKDLIAAMHDEAKESTRYGAAIEYVENIDGDRTSFSDVIEYVRSIYMEYPNSAIKEKRSRMEEALKKAYKIPDIDSIKSIFKGLINDNSLMVVDNSDGNIPNIYIFDYEHNVYRIINKMGRTTDAKMGNDLLYRIVRNSVVGIEMSKSLRDITEMLYIYVSGKDVKKITSRDINAYNSRVDVVKDDMNSPLYLLDYENTKIIHDVEEIKKFNIIDEYPTLLPPTPNKKDSLVKYMDKDSGDIGIENIKTYICSLGNSKMENGKMSSDGKTILRRIAEMLVEKNQKYMWMISGKSSSGKSFLFDQLLGSIYTSQGSGVKQGNTKQGDVFGYLEQAACEGDMVYVDDIDKTKIGFDSLYSMLGKRELTYNIKYENEITRERRANFVCTLNSVPKIAIREGDVRFFNKNNIVGNDLESLLPSGWKDQVYKGKFYSRADVRIAKQDVEEIIKIRCEEVIDLNKDYDKPFGDIEEDVWNKITRTMLSDRARQFFIDCIYNLKVECIKNGVVPKTEKEVAYTNFQKDMAEFMSHNGGFMPDWMEEINTTLPDRVRTLEVANYKVEDIPM